MELRKYLSNVVENKNIIVNNWIKKKEVDKIFHEHDLQKDLLLNDNEFFLIDYYLLLISDNNVNIELLKITEVLDLFEAKNIKYHELFIICNTFKSSFEYYFQQNNIFTSEIENDILLVFDLSFEIISKKYYSYFEKKIKEQQTILLEQSKSAAMGEMISMIAHQWRQPLQTVSILVQKLPLSKIIEGELKDEVIEQIVTDVGIQIDYMAKTIDDFRDFFKPNKSKVKIKLSELIDKVVDFLLYMLNIDSIKLTVNKIEDKTVSIYINDVIQVLINIIKNSRDAMLSRDVENRIINITLYVENEYAIIDIEDNAGGIKDDVIDKIFNPYFTTKSEKNGTGLGLYMSKKIIEEHCDGKISVSNSTNGALFRIKLPI